VAFLSGVNDDTMEYIHALTSRGHLSAAAGQTSQRLGLPLQYDPKHRVNVAFEFPSGAKLPREIERSKPVAEETIAQWEHFRQVGGPTFAREFIGAPNACQSYPLLAKYAIWFLAVGRCL
jgi:hypothetical protein